MTKIRTRAALAAIPLALGALAIGASTASANSSYWDDNGSGTCAYAQSRWGASASGELGTYCMQSVTGWIQINGGASQNQAISCSNNAPGGSPGLSWSLDGQAYVNDPEWYDVGIDGTNPLSYAYATFVGWQTGTGSASLSAETWYDGVNTGNTTTGSYGSAGASVSNFGGSGNWQAALACVNAAGVSASGSGYAESERTSGAMARIASPSTQAEDAAPVRTRDKKIDTVDTKNGKAFLAREYALKTNVTRTDTRTCPAGMVRKGKLAYTVQEFPANRKAPKWKDRALVDVTMTPKGKNGGSVKMTVTRAKHPTVVQFQMRCAKA
jgi:hypothetical protein